MAPPTASPPHVDRWKLSTGVTLEVATAEPAGGGAGARLVVLLHGFPDLWQTWKHQIAALTAAGYRVVAPNQRGYARSDKPAGVHAYDLEPLAADVAAIIERAGAAAATVVGHDWGGVIGWWAAATVPSVERAVILNAPHPGIFRRYVLRHPGQMVRSLYAGFFQIPRVPEWLLRMRDFRRMRAALERTSRADAFTADEWAVYRDAWSQPGALTGMIHYYRALFRRSERPLRRRVEKPTLLLWGKRDTFEQIGLAGASLELCPGGRLRVFDKATHWLHREEPDAVNAEMVSFLREGIVTR